jgi:4-carboxymuconolactone decarboxylase
MSKTDESAPRVAPLLPPEWNDDILDALGAFPKSLEFVLSAWNAGDHAVRGLHALGTVAHHPPLAKAFMAFNAHVAGANTLSLRDRELVILRLSWLHNSEYELVQHLVIGRRAGITEAEFEQLERGPDASGWTEADATLLRAVDEIHDAAKVQAATWQRLQQRYSIQQILDFLFLVGCYGTLAVVFNSLQVQLEDGAPALSEPLRERLQVRLAARRGNTPETREAQILGQAPRIEPATLEELGQTATDSTSKLRKAASGSTAPVAQQDIPEMMRTLLRHPDLYQRVAEVSIQLLGRGTIAPRERELVVLRVAWLCRAPYEWGEHVRMAKAAGLCSDEIERITAGSTEPGWTAHERALLRAAEELHADAMISDATWKVLAHRFNTRQLLELPVLVGQFTNVAYFQNALRVRLAPGNSGLRAR